MPLCGKGMHRLRTEVPKDVRESVDQRDSVGKTVGVRRAQISMPMAPAVTSTTLRGRLVAPNSRLDASLHVGH